MLIVLTDDFLLHREIFFLFPCCKSSDDCKISYRILFSITLKGNDKQRKSKINYQNNYYGVVNIIIGAALHRCKYETKIMFN